MLKRKVMDFIKKENGSISKKSALTLGAILTIVGGSVGVSKADDCFWDNDPSYGPCGPGPAKVQYCWEGGEYVPVYSFCTDDCFWDDDPSYGPCGPGAADVKYCWSPSETEYVVVQYHCD